MNFPSCRCFVQKNIEAKPEAKPEVHASKKPRTEAGIEPQTNKNGGRMMGLNIYKQSYKYIYIYMCV